MFGEHSSAIFDIKNETFTFYDDYYLNLSESKKFMLEKYMLSLENNHILLFLPMILYKYNRFVEYYIENGKLICDIKEYRIPYVPGTILYIGNDQFLYIRNGETYIWKRKGP